MGKKKQQRKKREQSRHRAKQRRQRRLRRRNSRVEAQLVSRDRIRIRREVLHIVGQAAGRDARIVTLGDLVLFSTETGDAWMLDPGDGLARCLARDGEPLPHGIQETDEEFSIEWSASFGIEGERFVVTEGSGLSRTILGYPTAEIAERCRQVAGGELQPHAPSSRRSAGASQEATGNGGQEDSARSGDGAAADGEIDWTLATTDVPVDSVLGGLDRDPDRLDDAVESFVWMLKKGGFVTWEAVIREEQGLPLSAVQEEQLGGLLRFVDDDEDEDALEEERILYVDGIGRPTKPWHESLRRLASHLRLPEVRTAATYFDVQLESWSKVRAALERHGADLSLPAGIARPLDVVPEELRHRLEVQDSLTMLVGIGQDRGVDAPPTLRDPEEHWRVDALVERLLAARESVAALGLTLEMLKETLVLPADEWDVFAALVRERLGLDSDAEPLAARLQPAR